MLIQFLLFTAFTISVESITLDWFPAGDVLPNSKEFRDRLAKLCATLEKTGYKSLMEADDQSKALRIHALCERMKKDATLDEIERSGGGRGLIYTLLMLFGAAVALSPALRARIVQALPEELRLRMQAWSENMNARIYGATNNSGWGGARGTVATGGGVNAGRNANAVQREGTEGASTSPGTH
jgi:hypothetical protein